MGKMRKILALCLAALLLCGCGRFNTETVLRKLMTGGDLVRYEDMKYVRPDMARVQAALDAVCEAAEGEDPDRVLEQIYAFYDLYDSYFTNYSLADIKYCADMTDIYWSGEYSYCMENSAAVEAALEEMYYALAKSPRREALESEDYFGAGYFDSYEGENQWDGEFTALLERESALQNRYYELSEAGLSYESGTEEYYDACADGLMEVLVELIRVRQEQAAAWGYSSYPQFAAELYYYRDYTTAQTDVFLDDIKRELVPLYRQVNESGYWDGAYRYGSERETLRYVRSAAKAMGGTVEDAFALLETAGLYDIGYGENKYDTSFEVYLTSYYEPFIFMNPTQTQYDCLSFAHESGHFCCDYASYGSYAGTDVLEVFSQGMEYLSLCYGDDTEDLTKMKMADSLMLYVEQAAFARFEQEMYTLTGDNLTAENLTALYDRIALEYGFDSTEYDPREFVDISHYFTNPMYIISYVVSNDAAMQLYQMEQQEPGAGLRCFEENLTTEAAYFLEFLESAGLESPFADGRIAEIRATFEAILN